MAKQGEKWDPDVYYICPFQENIMQESPLVLIVAPIGEYAKSYSLNKFWYLIYCISSAIALSIAVIIISAGYILLDYKMHANRPTVHPRAFALIFLFVIGMSMRYLIARQGSPLYPDKMYHHAGESDWSRGTTRMILNIGALISGIAVALMALSFIVDHIMSHAHIPPAIFIWLAAGIIVPVGAWWPGRRDMTEPA